MQCQPITFKLGHADSGTKRKRCEVHFTIPTFQQEQSCCLFMPLPPHEWKMRCISARWHVIDSVSVCVCVCEGWGMLAVSLPDWWGTFYLTDWSEWKVISECSAAAAVALPLPWLVCVVRVFSRAFPWLFTFCLAGFSLSMHSIMGMMLVLAE